MTIKPASLSPYRTSLINTTAHTLLSKTSLHTLAGFGKHLIQMKYGKKSRKIKKEPNGSVTPSNGTANSSAPRTIIEIRISN